MDTLVQTLQKMKDSRQAVQVMNWRDIFGFLNVDSALTPDGGLINGVGRCHQRNIFVNMIGVGVIKHWSIASCGLYLNHNYSFGALQNSTLKIKAWTIELCT